MYGIFTNICQAEAGEDGMAKIEAAFRFGRSGRSGSASEWRDSDR